MGIIGGMLGWKLQEGWWGGNYRWDGNYRRDHGVGHAGGMVWWEL